MTTMGDGEALNFEWDPQVVDAISEALAEIAETYELSSRVKAALPGELADNVKAFIRALDYHQRRPSGRRSSVDDLYGPMFTMTAGDAYPELLSSVAAETVAAWADAVRVFKANDVVVGRLCDLLWSIKAKPRPDLHGRAAQAAFRRHGAVRSSRRCIVLMRSSELWSWLASCATRGWLLRPRVRWAQPSARLSPTRSGHQESPFR